MPDALVILANGPVAGEKARVGGIEYGTTVPLLGIAIDPLYLLLRLGVGGKIVQHQIGVGNISAIPEEQGLV